LLAINNYITGLKAFSLCVFFFYAEYCAIGAVAQAPATKKIPSCGTVLHQKLDKMIFQHIG